MILHAVMCASCMLLPSQSPAAPEDAAAAPAAQETSSQQEDVHLTSRQNLPPALYDPAAEQASQDRNAMLQRALGWAGAAVAAAGLGVVALGLAAVSAGAAAWWYAQHRGGTAAQYAGNTLWGTGAVVSLLALPVAAVGSVWFVLASLSHGV